MPNAIGCLVPGMGEARLFAEKEVGFVPRRSICACLPQARGRGERSELGWALQAEATPAQQVLTELHTKTPSIPCPLEKNWVKKVNRIFNCGSF